MQNAKDTDVVIIDYGVGNLFNVQRAFSLIGARSVISSNPKDILSARRLLLPGVGAFESGMRHLHEYALVEAIRERASDGCPVLGICLGMQLLMSRSEEGGAHQGLDLIKGQVRRFQNPTNSGFFYKIPQIGWNALQQVSHPQEVFLEGIGEDPYVYFVHSYCVYPEDTSVWLASTDYGRDQFCSVLAKGKLFGCQFHPERSGEQGLRILKNFIAIS